MERKPTRQRLLDRYAVRVAWLDLQAEPQPVYVRERKLGLEICRDSRAFGEYRCELAGHFDFNVPFDDFAEACEAAAEEVLR